MHILYYTHHTAGSFKHGGGALAIWYAADAIAELSDIHLSIVFIGELTAEVESRFKGRAELIGIKNEEELPIVIQERAPDIFHSMLPSSESGMRYCKAAHIPIVYEVRSAKCYPCKFIHKLKPPYLREWKQMIKGRADRRAAGLADLVIVPSLTAQIALEKFYGVSVRKSRALYNGVNREIFYPKPDMRERDVIRIINAGRVERDRNFDMVISAFVQLTELVTDKNLELVLAGDGSQRDNIEMLVKDINGIKLVGAVPPERLAELYRSADFLLNASESESFGNVVAEAMSCGLPVVCFAAGSLVELVVDKETGFLCELHNGEDLVRYSLQLIQDEGLRERMGRGASKRASDNFSWEQRALEVGGIYQSLLVG
jgi:glycosyltransferase involved in cell wall biosynthesis